MMASLSISQTFSRILDPLDSRYNYINDMQIHDGSIYMSSYHCYIGIAPKLGCNQQSKWSLAGDLEKSVLIDSLFSQGRNNVVLLDNNIGFSGTWVQKEYTFENPITILEFDQNLDIVSKQLTHSIEGEHYFNDGLVHIEGYNYLYGNIKDQGATVYEKTQEIAYTFEGSLVSPSNQWNEVSYDFQGTAFNRRYTFATDSTFTNGNWYYELLRSWDETGNNWENTGEYFRKSGSKIYQIVEGEDYTLYDFSLVEGDTFTIAETSNIPERKLIVSQIDSVSLMDNSKRKRLGLRCEDDPDASLYGERIWIEGVGDLQGLLSVDESCTLDQNSKLLCFYDDDQALYQDPIEGKCWITTSTKELIDYGIEIFPNPVKNRIVISGLNGAAGYKLYTSNGATILSGQTNGEIDVNSLSSGLYLLEFSIEGKSITTRVIKD